MVATDLPPPDVVRGEFAGAGGAIEAHRVTPAMTEFLVHFPVAPGGRAMTARRIIGLAVIGLAVIGLAAPVARADVVDP